MSSLRERRTAIGWSQAELAAAAGVSRQLVSAVESDRHEPGVTAAVALAAAVGCSVEELFGSPPPRTPPMPVVGPGRAGPVRVGRVRDRLVVAGVSPLDVLGGAGSDGRWDGDDLRLADGARAAEVVLVGCEPALGLLAWPSHASADAIWVAATSAAARAAVEEGRAHLAAVHERVGRLPEPSPGIASVALARWRVGIAYQPTGAPSALDAIGTGGPVAQRDAGAAAQGAFVRWLRRVHRRRPVGPVVGGHVEACQLVVCGAAVAGVTSEPAAEAAGLAFDPMEEHEVRLWCPQDLLGDPAVARTLDRVTSAAFARRLRSFPGYDTSPLGRQAS